MVNRRADQALLLLLGSADLAITSLAWLLAYALRWGWDVLPAPVDTPPFWWCVRSLPLVVLCALLSYRLAGLYQIGRRWTLAKELSQAIKATGLMLLFMLATTFFVRNPYESRGAVLLFAALTVVGLIGVRRGFGVYFRFSRRWRGQAHRALIVGSGRTARHVERALRLNRWLGMIPIGFVEDPDASGTKVGPPTVGAVDDLPGLVEKYEVDFVFIALPLRRYAETQRIFRKLAGTLVEIRLVPDVPRRSSMAVEIDQFEGLPILHLSLAPNRLLETVLKRGMDIVLSAIGILILSPFLTLIGAIIKLSDGGPIFYSQERMGLNGHKFNMYKFRSMRVNAESDTGPVWARQEDDRRTRFGAFLRQTSIDELPQLYNVLIGDMSLVGPRPERPYFINKFRQSIPKYMLRHAVKAGITGWAQVHGWRGNTSLRKRVQYDLFYINHWSLALDLRILVLTLFRVLRDHNAY